MKYVRCLWCDVVKKSEDPWGDDCESEDSAGHSWNPIKVEYDIERLERTIVGAREWIDNLRLDPYTEHKDAGRHLYKAILSLRILITKVKGT